MWCAKARRQGNPSNQFNKCLVNVETLSDAELVGHCLPASKVREEDWQMISASRCVWPVVLAPFGLGKALQCEPDPGAKFEYVSLARGFTHRFDLRFPW